MILWVNGTFGVGKTTTATEVRASAPEWRLFDPEWVGYMLKVNLDGVEFSDFQDLPAWRTLVPAVASEVVAMTGDDLLAVQTVLVEQYWHELRDGLSERGLDVVHVVLDCDPQVLRSRIEADQVERGAREWRLEHVERYLAAKPWMTSAADLVVDTTHLTAQQVAASILEFPFSPG